MGPFFGTGSRCENCGCYVMASQAHAHVCNPDATAAYTMEKWRKELASLETEATRWMVDWGRSRAKEFQDWLKKQGRD